MVSNITLILTAFGLAIVVKLIRSHVIHPLWRFPGPCSASFSNVWHSWTFLAGRQPYDMLAIHEKYGPVVRTAPNELSFNTAGSWRDIYGFRPGHLPFVKSAFYDGGSFADHAHSIVSERDPAAHGIMRKYLSHAFSDKSLKQQESLVAQMVDLFIDQIGSKGSGPEGLNMVMWFNLLTFDVIGSLAFGEPFGGLESGEFHPWIGLVTGALRQGALADFMSRFPLLASLMRKLMPNTIDDLVKDTRTHEAYTMSLVEKRLKKKSDRPDFLARMLEQRKLDKISNVQIAAHCSDFVTAGSETTATTLACITYYLMHDSRVCQKLQREVRERFKNYEEIDAISTAPLRYLNAVILEGMRIYSPLPFALPRVVPPGGDTVDGQFVPEGTIVSTNPVAASMSSTNFENPFAFVPERWTDENQVDVLEASQPFSLGARGCLGRNLAWIELNTTLAKLHWKYELEPLNQSLNWQASSKMHTLWLKPELQAQVFARKL